jgi:uncharacterized protein YvpB
LHQVGFMYKIVQGCTVKKNIKIWVTFLMQKTLFRIFKNNYWNKQFAVDSTFYKHAVVLCSYASMHEYVTTEWKQKDNYCTLVNRWHF